ncbi:PP2C family protein-serine/threonine phosphatase [Actinomyces trachealis]|uniref:PP2C family protein-serine/threonine phosphatase n=1 Tax=Actinomyces trachealis TaxID=2763540 RepID=UPI001892C26D|nr:PP2C family serine/threonine-protein phosphatase [Actinomyces trachealis]
MTIYLRFAARSDVGLVRQSNQDSGYVGPHLALLCDGMGGPAGGDIASAVAIEHLTHLDSDIYRADEMLDLLRHSVQNAHADLISRSSENPDLSGLGTTCIAIMRSGNKLAMVHVGDSRAYLVRGGVLTQVTTDHTFVEYLVETGRLTREQARRHPQRSVLLRVLGDTEGEVQLDESIREALPGDRWLLCSDGLCGPVTADTLQEVLTTNEDPGQAADKLIDLALRAGGPDNVTAVVFDVVEGEPTNNPTPQVVGSAAAIRSRNEALLDGSDPGRVRTSASSDSSSPAGKAAALLAQANSQGKGSSERLAAQEALALAEAAELQALARRRSRRSAVLGTLLLVVALAVAGLLAYKWTQTQYYVTAQNDRVVIYQGVPRSLGPVSLSHLVETYDGPNDPKVSSLDKEMRNRLEQTVSESSLEAAHNYVENTVRNRLADAVLPGASEPSATPSATPAPSTPSPSPTPSSGV